MNIAEMLAKHHSSHPRDRQHPTVPQQSPLLCTGTADQQEGHSLQGKVLLEV